jgi:hypothetical protein
MSVEIQWTDADPETGAKRFVSVERFAGKWEFHVRFKRRENWATPAVVTRDMWETLLDAVERRVPRREGVTLEDVKTLRRILAALKEPPTAAAEELP